MLKTRLLHPGILATLATAGHGSKVLIADSNYPFATTAGPSANVAYLNFAPGMINVPDILKVLLDTIPVEAAHVMMPDSGDEPPIFGEFRKILGKKPELEPMGRFDFYESVKSPDCALIIASGEQRIYANILLTIGVVAPE